MNGLKKFTNNIFYFINRVFQPITFKPNLNSSVSDLFFWRNDSGYKTYYELVDVLSLINTHNKCSVFLLVIFNSSGDIINKVKVTLKNYQKKSICINDYLSSPNKFGTFAVFLLNQNLTFDEYNKPIFFSERGYLSISRNDSDLKHYAHGNLDSISYDKSNSKIHYLAGLSFLRKEYRVQFLFAKNTSYKIILINGSFLKQNFYLYVKRNNNSSSDFIEFSSVKIKKGGLSIIDINLDYDFILKINSRLVMARPVIIKEGAILDVFHS